VNTSTKATNCFAKRLSASELPPTKLLCLSFPSAAVKTKNNPPQGSSRRFDLIQNETESQANHITNNQTNQSLSSLQTDQSASITREAHNQRIKLETISAPRNSIYRSLRFANCYSTQGDQRIHQ
jgi:hypothetical protein